jgi:hypothetical protein
MKPHPALAANPHPCLIERKHTWRYYALISCGALLLLGAAILAGLYTYARAFIGKYTTAQPAPIPATQFTVDDRQALMAKWSEFLNVLAAGQPSSPLAMSSKEVNVFLAMMPRLQQRIHVTIAENKLRAEFAMPLDALAGHPLPVIPKGVTPTASPC